MTILTELTAGNTPRGYGIGGREIIVVNSANIDADLKIMESFNTCATDCIMFSDTRNVKKVIAEMEALCDPLTKTFQAFSLTYDVDAKNPAEYVRENFSEDLRKKFSIHDDREFHNLAEDVEQSLVRISSKADLYEAFYITVFHKPVYREFHKDALLYKLEKNGKRNDEIPETMASIRRLNSKSVIVATHEGLVIDGPSLYPEQAFYLEGQSFVSLSGRQVHASPDENGFGYFIDCKTMHVPPNIFG